MKGTHKDYDPQILSIAPTCNHHRSTGGGVQTRTMPGGKGGERRSSLYVYTSILAHNIYIYIFAHIYMSDIYVYSYIGNKMLMAYVHMCA